MFELVSQTHLLSLQDAINICEATNAITQYAVIIHDKDVDDLGNPKVPHLHLMCKLKPNYNCSYENIAKWFGVPTQFINKIKAGRYEKGLPYLTHQNAPEKFQYSEDEVYANFDWRVAILKEETKASIDEALEAVAKGKISLREARTMVGDLNYTKNLRKFKDAHTVHLEDVCMPSIRQTFYIEAVGTSIGLGKGGMGKTVSTHALAKLLASEFGADISMDYEDLQDYIFDCGDPKVAVQRYQGQPILVLNEMTAYDLKKAFGGPRGVKELLETFPTKQDVNIKNSSTIITAKYIIINGIQPFETFKDELSGEFVDSSGHQYRSEKGAREQYDRRFWVHIKIIDEDYMDILFNKGLFDDTKEYQQYIEIKNIKVNWKKLIQNLSGQALSTVEKKVFAPIIDRLEEYNNSRPIKVSDANEIPDEFLCFGEYEHQGGANEKTS